MSASSRFFGAAAAMAFFTAAMKAALSKPPGLAAAIFSTWAALAWLALSSPGPLAAACALPTSWDAGGCFFNCWPADFAAPETAVNFGSDFGFGADGGTGGAKDEPGAALCTSRSDGAGVVVDSDSRPGAEGPASATAPAPADVPRAVTIPATAAFPALRCNIAMARGFIKLPIGGPSVSAVCAAAWPPDRLHPAQLPPALRPTSCAEVLLFQWGRPRPYR